MKNLKFVKCNQWLCGDLSEYGINLLNIGWNCNKCYVQGDIYTVGISLLGFACGVEFMIESK